MLMDPENIKKALSQTLPGSESHLKMLPQNRKLTISEEEKPAIKHSSVLLLLTSYENELTALLIKRPSHMKHHAGQIALPGGKAEKNETLLETALRETWEETGFLPEKIEILGNLTDLYVQVSKFMIHPFVGWISCFDSIQINRHEVEKVLFFPIKNLAGNRLETELHTPTGKLNVPCYQYENEIIWGATSMILTEFFDSLQKNRVIL